MKKVLLNKVCQGLLAALVGVIFVCTFTSCSNEPNVYIDYYLSIKSTSPIFNHEGELPLDASLARIGNAIRMMQDGIKESYPEKDASGNDVAVITACKNVYYQFRSPDDSDIEHSVCVATLYRAVMSDGIIKQSTRLVTFTFG